LISFSRSFLHPADLRFKFANESNAQQEIYFSFHSLRHLLTIAYETPFLVEHTDLLCSVNDCLRLLLEGGTNREETLDNIQIALAQFGQDVADLIDQLTDGDNLNLEGIAHDDTLVWRHQTAAHAASDDPEEVLDHHKALDELLYLLSDYEMDEVVVRYVLNPFVGSSVLCHTAEMCLPIYVNVLPEKFALRISDEVLAGRVSKHREPEDDEDFDEFQENEELEFFQSARTTLSHPSTEHQRTRSLIARKKGKTVIRKDDRSQKHTKLEKIPTGLKDSGRESRPYASSSGITDDDYVSGGTNSLIMKAKSFTLQVKSQPENDLRHDHMSRFNTTSSRPVPLKRTDIKPGDYRVIDGHTVYDQLYVVTYSRNDRKPIFNPVAGRR